MQRLGAGAGAGRDDRLDVEVGADRRVAEQLDRLVGLAHRERAGVLGVVDDDGRDAEAAQRPHDAHRDLAAVGDEHLRRQAHVSSPSRSQAAGTSIAIPSSIEPKLLPWGS